MRVVMIVVLDAESTTLDDGVRGTTGVDGSSGGESREVHEGD